jgi:YHS domain-containing protein
MDETVSVQVGETMKDPVCGMDVSPDTAAGTVVHDGRPYYFCSEPCRIRFTEEPVPRAIGESMLIALQAPS